MRIPGLAAALLTLTFGAAAAEPAPRIPVNAFSALPTPLPRPFDDKADAARDVARGEAEARASGRLLVLDFGANWCADCRILAGVIGLPSLAPYMSRHYVVVPIDIGRFDRNLDIAGQFGDKRRIAAAPTILIWDPQTRTLLNARRTDALSDARFMTPQMLADYFAAFAGPDADRRP